MQDESLIDEMREVLRADRERAELRRLGSPPASPVEPSRPVPAPEPSSPAAGSHAEPRGLFARLRGRG